MKSYYIKNALIFQKGQMEAGALTVRSGLIEAVGARNEGGLPEIDAGGNYLIPGFIDSHTHGAYGVDCIQSRAEDLCRLSLSLAGRGVTSWLCTLATESKELTIKALSEAASALSMGGPGAELLGIHLEGPFVSQAYRAAFEADQVREIDTGLFLEYWEASRGNIRAISLAPELPGALDLISLCLSLGIRVSLGHSDATWEETRAACEVGASCVTHLGNAMRPLHHREPGILGAALDSDLYTELICDGLHLHPAFVRLVEKLKNPDRLIAITDSMMAAGLADGDYRLGSQTVKVREGQARLEGGKLAGSTLTMDQALRNLLEFTGGSLASLIPCFSTHAANWLGLQERKGAIAPGLDADLVIMDQDFGICRVFCRGEEIALADAADEEGG